MLHHHTHLNLPSRADWLLPGIIPVGGLVIIASAPKTGKTVFANAFSRAMCSGGEFAGVSWGEKVPVAWCAHEETREERGPLLAGLNEDDPYYLAFPPELLPLDSPECDYSIDRFGRRRECVVPYVYHDAAHARVRLIVIDCLHSAVRHTNLAENHAARRIMDKLRHWADSFGIATVVLHHLTKSAHRGYHPERFADSAQILAAASCHFFLESRALDDGTWSVVLHGSGRQPAPPARQEFVASSLFDYSYVREKARDRPLTVADKIESLLQGGWELTADEIASKTGCDLRTVRTILPTVKGVCKVSTPRQKLRYRLDLDEEDYVDPAAAPC